ncbi:MAG: hypothetical protein P8020_14590 [Acidobacteriota bacterium]|jgi:hypothetical protein
MSFSMQSSNADRTPVSDEELKRMFGDNAVITRVGRFNLVHLDNPSQEELDRRIREFDPREYFEDDCPLCRMMREEGGNIVYDGLL